MSTTISGTNGVTFPDSTSMQTGQQACKAWVNFDGTGTVSIINSYNVSSITDNGTGDYTVNILLALPTANYVWVGFSKDDDDSGAPPSPLQSASFEKTTTALRINTKTPSTGTKIDSPNAGVVFFC